MLYLQNVLLIDLKKCVFYIIYKLKLPLRISFKHYLFLPMLPHFPFPQTFGVPRAADKEKDSRGGALASQEPADTELCYQSQQLGKISFVYYSFF